jgi:hypothetical protein
MLTERDIIALLEREPLELKPLSFVQAKVPHAREVDAVYDLNLEGKQIVRFLAEVKARATSQALAAAAQRAKSHVFDARGSSFPLVIVPYLSPSSLDEVERLGISAVDLCGNGVVQVPQQLLVLRSGKPNRFRGSNPLRGAYRGVASLVGRALLAQPRFARVSDVLSFIKERGGRLTLATVSKALARLEEDLVVAREPKSLRLLQADKLLSRLREAYQPPSIRSKLSLKTTLSGADLHRQLRGATDVLGERLALTGISSASLQTVIAAEPVTAFYCSARPEELAKAASINPAPERHFANLELLQTDDERVYFDSRTEGGRLLASPVQTWLELAAGDKRSQEVADELRVRLMRESETKPEEGTSNG